MFHRRFLPKYAVVSALFTCLFLAPGAWGEAVYTWVDEDGVRHFAQQPPTGVDYEMKDVKVTLPTTPAAAPAGAAGSVDEQVDEFLAGQEAERQKRQLSRAEKAAMEQNCQIARANLVAVESRTRVMVPEADGSMRQLTDDERLAAVSQAQEDVGKFCQD